MPFGYFRRILSSTVFILNIVVVIGFGGWGKVGKIASFRLNSLHLSHGFHGLLEFVALNFPFGDFFFLFFAEIGLFGFLYFVFLGEGRNIFLLSFAYFFMLPDSISCKFSSALVAPD